MVKTLTTLLFLATVANATVADELKRLKIRDIKEISKAPSVVTECKKAWLKEYNWYAHSMHNEYIVYSKAPIAVLKAMFPTPKGTKSGFESTEQKEAWKLIKYASSLNNPITIVTIYANCRLSKLHPSQTFTGYNDTMEFSYDTNPLHFIYGKGKL